MTLDDARIDRREWVTRLLLTPESQLFSSSIIALVQHGRICSIPLMYMQQWECDLRGFVFPAYVLRVLKGHYVEVAIPVCGSIVRIRVALANVASKPGMEELAKKEANRILGFESGQYTSRWASVKVKRMQKMPTVIGTLITMDGTHLSLDLLDKGLVAKYESPAQAHAAGSSVISDPTCEHE